MKALIIESANIEPYGQSNVVSFPKTHCTAHRLQALTRWNDREMRTLDRLRWLAIRAKCSQCEDLEKACFLVAKDDDITFERYAALFFNGLKTHTKRIVAFQRPGSKSVTSDENWLLRILFLIDRNPDMSAAMLDWYMDSSSKRWMWFLAKGMRATLPEYR